MPKAVPMSAGSWALGGRRRAACRVRASSDDRVKGNMRIFRARRWRAGVGALVVSGSEGPHSRNATHCEIGRRQRSLLMGNIHDCIACPPAMGGTSGEARHAM